MASTTSSRMSRALTPTTALLKRVMLPTVVQLPAVMQLAADQLNDAACATEAITLPSSSTANHRTSAWKVEKR